MYIYIYRVNPCCLLRCAVCVYAVRVCYSACNVEPSTMRSLHLRCLRLTVYASVTVPVTYRMNEARLSHLPFWGPSEAFFLIIKRPSG